MKRAGTARRGIYRSDGIFNVALLKKEGDKEKLGLYHFGMWVDDLDAAEKKVVSAGGEYLAGRPTSPNSLYEAKYKSPTGLVFDLTHTGRAGAVTAGVPQKDDPISHKFVIRQITYDTGLAREAVIKVLLSSMIVIALMLPIVFWIAARLLQRKILVPRVNLRRSAARRRPPGDTLRN